MRAHGSGAGVRHARSRGAGGKAEQYHSRHGALLLVHYRVRPDAVADGVRAYGSGLLSSYGELEHSVTSPEVQRHPIQLEWAINQAFAIDHYQPLLFVVDSFDHLFSLADKLRSGCGKASSIMSRPGNPR
jgi:phenylalanine-4-hydroxylase